MVEGAGSLLPVVIGSGPLGAPIYFRVHLPRWTSAQLRWHTASVASFVCRREYTIGVRHCQPGGSYEFSGAEAVDAKASGAFVEVVRRGGAAQDRAVHAEGIQTPGSIDRSA